VLHPLHSNSPNLNIPLQMRRVVVYAETLYEAVIRGLNRLSDVGWVSNTGETIGQVKVEIYEEPTVHVLDVPKLLKWVKEKAGIPGVDTRKEKLRKILKGR
jgi:hypothetical protein